MKTYVSIERKNSVAEIYYGNDDNVIRVEGSYIVLTNAQLINEAPLPHPTTIYISDVNFNRAVVWKE